MHILQQIRTPQHIPVSDLKFWALLGHWKVHEIHLLKRTNFLILATQHHWPTKDLRLSHQCCWISSLLQCDNESLNEKFPPFHRTAIPSKVTNYHPMTQHHIPEDPNLHQISKLVDFCISSCNNSCDIQLERKHNQISNVLWFTSFGKIQPL